ncbi:MAG: NmrA family NAD(P)-binding protein [Anaerolineae bacterium]|nr:NmrA family NAD(P)-binding protein [Anaerolineae bacterium]
MTIIVTGAAGKTGQAIVAALARTGASVRALVRRPDQTHLLMRLGATEALVCDLYRADELRKSFAHARAVYHICPNVSPDEVQIGANVIAAAKQTEVTQVVYHSVLHPQTQTMPHHWNKLQVEEALFASGLDITILQPTAYMQNLLANWGRIRQDGILRNPYPVETRLSLVDLADVAEVAARVLNEAGHGGATYELVGTPALSQTQVAEVLSEALGRKVSAEAEPIAAWSARAAGLGMAQRETLIQMFEYYARHGLIGNPNVLGWLLGRVPTSLFAFARQAVGKSS